MKTEYAGHEITFDEQKEIWTADLGDLGTRENTSLVKLKAAIDRAGEERKKRVEAQAAFSIFTEWGASRVVPLRVTSKVEGNYGRAEFWTVDVRKDRTKRSAHEMYAHDDHNQTTLTAIKAVWAEEAALKEHRGKLIESLHPFVWQEATHDQA